jgi:hypothetical protein
MVFGIGLHVIVALFFAIHAVRTGQQIYWLLMLFSFPLLGSVVYFFAIYLPQSRLQHGARKTIAAVGRALDPTRELREARDAFNFTPTAQNQMRLAAALLAADNATEAAANYEACLKGPFASDLEIRLAAARAFFESGQFDRAISHLRQARADDTNFRAEQVSLLLARALAAAGQQPQAGTEFEAAANRFGSFEANAEYAMWALASGDRALADRLLAALDDTMARWSGHTRELQMPLVKRLQAARSVR